MTSIHPTAHVARGAELDDDVVVGPFSYIGSRVRVGSGTVFGPHVTVQGRTTIGCSNQFTGQAAIGGPPQDLKYAGEESALVMGDDNVVREFVTINIGTAAGSWITSIGNENLIMACAHVAHDCVIEDKVIISNNVLLAGHVRMESQSIIAGGSAVNHFATVGTMSMISGMCRVVKDVPPYMMYAGSPTRVRGVNIVGLQRSGHSRESIQELREAYKLLFADETPSSLALEELESRKGGASEVKRLISFLRDMDRGFQGRYREALRRPIAEAEAGA